MHSSWRVRLNTSLLSGRCIDARCSRLGASSARRGDEDVYSVCGRSARIGEGNTRKNERIASRWPSLRRCEISGNPRYLRYGLVVSFEIHQVVFVKKARKGRGAIMEINDIEELDIGDG